MPPTLSLLQVIRELSSLQKEVGNKIMGLSYEQNIIEFADIALAMYVQHQLKKVTSSKYPWLQELNENVEKVLNAQRDLFLKMSVDDVGKYFSKELEELSKIFAGVTEEEKSKEVFQEELLKFVGRVGHSFKFFDEIKQKRSDFKDAIQNYQNKFVKIIKNHVPEVEKIIGSENMNPQGLIAYAYGLPKPSKKEQFVKRLEELPTWQKAGLAAVGAAALAGVVYGIRKWYKNRKINQTVEKIKAMQEQVAQRALTQQQFQAQKEQILAPFSLEDTRKIEEKIVSEYSVTSPAWGG